MEAGLDEEALHQFRRSLELRASQPEAWSRIASIQRSNSQGEEARRSFQVELKKVRVDHAQFCRVLQQAVELDPRNAQRHLMLAEAQLDASMHAEALQATRLAYGVATNDQRSGVFFKMLHLELYVCDWRRRSGRLLEGMTYVLIQHQRWL